MIDLNTKCKTIKLLDCNIGALTSVVGKDFLNKTQIALTIMKKNDILFYIKIRNCCASKHNTE